MAPSENQQQPPNPAPPSLSAGAHETSYYYAEQNASRPPSQQEPYPTPYLGLRARLAQIWINRWTILLLLVLIRTLFAIASVDDNIGTARKQALSACTSVENVGSAMASMPHYMSEGMNEVTAQGIEKAVNGLMQMLILTLTGVEEIVVFIINLLTSTYVCLITLAISGSLHVAISVAEDVGDFLNSTAKDVGDDLGSAASDFQNAMNGFLSGINDIGDLTGDDSKPPTIDLSGEIDKLNNLELPSGYDQGLQTLNGSIPTFEQVQNLTNTAIRFPFEEVKKLLNESLPKYTMNRSLFPVPAKEQLTFCSDDDGVNDFFDDLVAIEQMAKKIFLGVITTLAILVMIPMAWREYRSWKTMNERARLVKDDAYDSLDAVYIVSRPYTAGAGLWLARKFKSPRRRALVRWSVAYATTVPALFVLSLAIAGLLGCLCQYTLLKSLEKEVPALENQVIGFSDKVMTSLNNASQQWAIGTNKIINDTNTDINDDVFGWVNTTTGAVNNTLNVFVDEMMGALNDTFGGTVLYDPIMDVLNCLVLLKIQGIQKGLTWVSEHAKIDIPMLPNDTFSLGTAQKVAGSESNILATGPDGAAADAITDAVDHVVRAFAEAIRQEAIISTCILLIWVIIALSGIIRAFYLFYRGGDAGVYHGQDPTARSSISQDKSYELSRIPTYEQATASQQPGNNRANMYNGQSYTLTPAPMPTFEVTSATSPIMHTASNPPEEKMGTVNGQNVDTAIRRPSHIRASSHGDYAVTSPMSPPQANPFLSANEIQDRNRNPFSDPRR
ncbi:hypothetical protein M409DRAFT_27910 [Zasmidium cellare ATCC 36951]|uniref:Plasma membrane fusion protein PRM1 n=1 Tax=Zasmidium cellare ATCC 36951 TaxID=1080233 RepID=A0A6A6C414_ZASCE|nr:uncharacterized protein M409DRAFT_27910 [Zasmidium cellare ATCC 36951]KAF2161854.1 hypothetical protein M409DRAFT_27910 [Zasmidium cellare ATCC 36951]